MKKWIVLTLAVLFVLPAAHAGIGAFGSWWNSKDYDTLYGGGIRLGMEIFSGLGVEARGSYLTTNGDNPDMSVVPLEVMALWKLSVSEFIKPYIGAGVGYYIKDVDWDNHHDLDVRIKDNDCVGYFGVGGVDIQIGPVTLFGEAKYNLIQDDDEFEWRGGNLEETYSLDGLCVNVGVKFGF
ncbi:MAG: porin family protein [Verrucomicrobiota bacterium]|jgi:outer membrane protein W|nr:porin family protein [Verrucomicrobiota bacterium]